MFFLSCFLPIRTSRDITRYCFEHVPESCTFVSIGKSGRAEEYSESNCPHSKGRFFKKIKHSVIECNSNMSVLAETCQSSSRWSNRAASPVPKPSPRTTIDDEEVGGESQGTEDDSCSSGDTSITESPPLASKTRKQPSPCRQLIASLFGSPMKRKGSSSHEGRQQPLLKCFSYEKISNATNNFHPGKIAHKLFCYNIQKA